MKIELAPCTQDSYTPQDMADYGAKWMRAWEDMQAQRDRAREALGKLQSRCSCGFEKDAFVTDRLPSCTRAIAAEGLK